MSKFSVTDLAADLGISTDDVLGMLRSLEVVVRAPSAPLTDDQAARVRARWERVMRERAAKAAAPAAAPARRRKAADAAPADSAAPADAADEAAPKAAAKPKAKSKAKVAEPEPVVEAPKAAATRRRRAADLPSVVGIAARRPDLRTEGDTEREATPPGRLGQGRVGLRSVSFAGEQREAERCGRAEAKGCGKPARNRTWTQVIHRLA